MLFFKKKKNWILTSQKVFVSIYSPCYRDLFTHLKNEKNLQKRAYANLHPFGVTLMVCRKYIVCMDLK